MKETKHPVDKNKYLIYNVYSMQKSIIVSLKGGSVWQNANITAES